MVVRHCGFTAVVKVLSEENWVGKPVPQDIEIEDQPEGGANALNVNRSVYVSGSDLIFYFFIIFLFLRVGWGSLSLCIINPKVLIPKHFPWKIYISA